MSGLRVLVWNTEWARAHTPRGAEIKRVLEAADPDVVCVTEGAAELLPGNGHVIDSDPDFGYRQQEGRRKVLLWSPEPWEMVDRAGHPDMPGGRYVEGRTTTRSGPVRVIGVCIPWRGAHVSTGRRDRKPWEDHRRFLSCLDAVLAREALAIPEIVAGDFNQRIPRFRTPKAVFRQLMNVFESRFSICTSGELEGADGPGIDHVAHTAGLEAVDVRVIPKVSQQGLRLSDHFGLSVELRNGSASRGR